MRVMIMQGELCLIECSKTNPSLRKENTENAKEFCMFLLNASGARIKKKNQTCYVRRRIMNAVIMILRIYN